MSGDDDDDDIDAVRRQRDQALSHARRVELELGEVRGAMKRLELIVRRRTARRARARAWAARARRLVGR